MQFIALLSNRQMIALTETLRMIFSATVEFLLIGSLIIYIIFNFQQLLLTSNFDQTHGYGDRIKAILYLHTKILFFSVFVLFYFSMVKFF
jgi:hypothetical protein